MTRLEAEPCAVWLQERLGAFVFAVDHPDLPHCAGAHRPGQPCDGTRGKHPCGRWSRDSTDNPEVIRAALSRGLRNLGIDCGKSGLLVVDEDRPGAFDSYAASAGQKVPVTFTVTTGKGRHVYFRQPPGVPLGNGTGTLAGRDMDVRGNGGFVVGPSSVHHSGVRYTPVDATAPVVPAPDWLVGALITPPAGALGHPGLRPHGSPHARLRGLVATVLDGQVGERNNLLHWASCRAAEMIAAGQLDRDAAIDVLARAGEAVGLAPGEVQATIASALRHAAT
jgi:Bifunctional DNA primase/polymerase, N-terminal